MVAHYTIFCFVWTLHHRSSVLSPFPFLSLSLSLSVMAYQDGFYSAADLYVSIPLSSLLPHSSPTFPPPLLPVGFQV